MSIAHALPGATRGSSRWLAPAFVGGGGIGSITFEPEAFTGARP